MSLDRVVVPTDPALGRPGQFGSIRLPAAIPDRSRHAPRCSDVRCPTRWRCNPCPASPSTHSRFHAAAPAAGYRGAVCRGAGRAAAYRAAAVCGQTLFDELGGAEPAAREPGGGERGGVGGAGEPVVVDLAGAVLRCCGTCWPGDPLAQGVETSISNALQRGLTDARAAVVGAAGDGVRAAIGHAHATVGNRPLDETLAAAEDLAGLAGRSWARWTPSSLHSGLSVGAGHPAGRAGGDGCRAGAGCVCCGAAGSGWGGRVGGLAGFVGWGGGVCRGWGGWGGGGGGGPAQPCRWRRLRVMASCLTGGGRAHLWHSRRESGQVLAGGHSVQRGDHRPALQSVGAGALAGWAKPKGEG